jgi:hypothetical protein
MVLLLGVTHITIVIPPIFLLLCERAKAEDSVSSDIVAGEGGEAPRGGMDFRNLAMEMEALQEKHPTSSMSETRKRGAGERARARSSPSHCHSLTLDHLLRLGGKLVLRRQFCFLSFLSRLRWSQLSSFLGDSRPPPGLFEVVGFGAAGCRSGNLALL